jgi:hypothetical protein
MKFVLFILTMSSLIACKTVSPGINRANLAATTETGREKSELQKIAGTYRFTGPDSMIYDLSNETTKTAVLSVARDGVVSLDVHFPVAIRSSTRLGPGVIASMIPDSQTRTETYTVGTDSLFSGRGTEERKIDTTDTIQKSAANAQEILLESKTVMYGRPYKWFNKPEWKVYKTMTMRIKGDGTLLTFTQESKELMGTENLSLTFTRN